MVVAMVMRRQPLCVWWWRLGGKLVLLVPGITCDRVSHTGATGKWLARLVSLSCPRGVRGGGMRAPEARQIPRKVGEGWQMEGQAS